MPPDSILGLLAFVGLCLYAIIGMIVGVLSMRYMGDHHDRMEVISEWHQLAYSDSHDDRIPVVMVAIVWPAWLVLLVPVGLVYCVVWIPARLGKHAAQYVAGALEEGRSHA